MDGEKKYSPPREVTNAGIESEDFGSLGLGPNVFLSSDFTA
jgi:hypothetical protein